MESKYAICAHVLIEFISRVIKKKEKRPSSGTHQTYMRSDASLLSYWWLNFHFIWKNIKWCKIDQIFTLHKKNIGSCSFFHIYISVVYDQWVAYIKIYIMTLNSVYIANCLSIQHKLAFGKASPKWGVNYIYILYICYIKLYIIYK